MLVPEITFVEIASLQVVDKHDKYLENFNNCSGKPEKRLEFENENCVGTLPYISVTPGPNPTIFGMWTLLLGGKGYHGDLDLICILIRSRGQ